MREYFRAKIIDEQEHQANRLPFRRKFFTDDCRYDSHAETLQRMESEKVVSVEETTADSKVITEQIFDYLGKKKTIRLRYHLQVANDDWLIRKVQAACYICEGRGDSSCPHCEGKLWLGSG